MRESVRKVFRYTVLCVAILLALSFFIVYQEFGPIDQGKLIEHRVRQAGLVADFIYPKGGEHLPVIIALGGSGGGFLPDKEMQALALHGYAVLSVAYFSVEGLPSKIENIPLEYFGNAISWGTAQPAVNSSKLFY